MGLEPARIKYRADIDGLRALAVGAVILYHARVPGFAGGYVGVDVFFVISGFLITQLLDQVRGAPWTPALANFYLRRARRLLPALFVMLAVCTVLATALYFPKDLKNYGRSLVYSVAFLGNFGAAMQGGYFDPGARFAPLRHLWSLGVEEQFYLLYPLALLATSGLRKSSQAALLVALATGSLLLSFWGAVHAPVLNFYMLPTRAWELMTGAVLATTPLRTKQRTNELLGACGIVGILIVVGYARVITFPGTAGLVTSLCTGMLIVANASGRTTVARILSLRPLVFTGLISYSLYLWHAPLIAFLDYYSIREPSAPVLGLTLLVTYLISTASWVFIEQPVRTRKLAAAPRAIIAAAAFATVVFAALGYGFFRADGLPGRMAVLPPAIAEESPEFSAMEARCTGLPLAEITVGHLCSFGPQTDSAPRVLVWGDSHAGVLLPVYQSLAIARKVRIYFGIRGACWPLPGAEAAGSGEFWRARCAAFNAAMLQAVEQLNPQRVILNAYWLDPGAKSEPEFRRRVSGHGTEVSDALNTLLAGMRRRGRSVCAVLTVPGYDYPIPYAVAMAQRRNIDDDALALARSDALREFQSVEAQLRLQAGQDALRIADPKDVICPGDRCVIRAPGGALLYRDANHVSLAGARFLSGTVERCLADLK
ncbi:MAG: acyltransferase [Proteobacteria bacterium]|nr:acyltransferase [Pseudomonadota bacterium]